jgi:hypothetical protein
MAIAGRTMLAAGLLALAGAAALLAFSGRGDAGLEGIPALTAEALDGIPERELLGRVHTDLSLRAGSDWRKHLSEAQRHLFAIAALEDAVASPTGFLAQVLAERSGGIAARPQLAELIPAYRWLGLPAAADAVAAGLAAGDGATEQLDAWARYDLSDPGRGPAPANPFTDVAQVLRAASASSPALRSAWIRAHPDELLAR